MQPKEFGGHGTCERPRTMLAEATLAVAVTSAAPTPAAVCEVYWRYIGGKEDPESLSTPPRALLDFARFQPWWYYGPRDRLQWRPLQALARLRRVGTAGALRIYEASYSGLGRALVWDRGDGSACPALIFDAEGLVEDVEPARLFRWQGRDLVHVRVHLAGTGHHQESIFFAVDNGGLVPLRPDAADAERIRSFLDRHGLVFFHRGLGFCEGRLVEQQIVEFKDGTPRAGDRGGVQVRYRVEGDRMVVDTIEQAAVYPCDETCVVFPAR